VRKLIKRLRAENGQAIVELAFVLPIVLLLLFGIIDFGLALNNQNQDTNIANIAVREAAVVGTTTYAMCGTTTEKSLYAWASCEATTMGAPPITNFCVYDTASTATGTTYTTGDPVEVKVQSSFSWLKIISGNVQNLSSTIGASATMREEGTFTAAATTPFLTNSSPNSC
jgi:Flp pilus assembly protein TadG